MASTTLANVDLQSEVFKDLVSAYFTHRLAFLNSLLVEAPDALIPPDSKGYTIAIPNVDSLTGDADQITSSLTTTVNAAGTWKDIGAWVEREKAWGADQIIKTIAGYDMVDEVAKQLGEYWANQLHGSAINLLTGVFGSALTSTHVKDDSGNTINDNGVADTKQLLGDNADELTSIVLNSKVYTDAVKAGIVYQDGSIGGVRESGQVGKILGLNPFITDKLTVSSGVYSSYLGKAGSLIYKFRKRQRQNLTAAEVYDLGFIEVEKYRVSTTGGGQDVLISRASYLVHCPGVQFDGTVTSNPTDAELATSTTWTKVADDDKKIKILQYKSN
jgi:hypothetical protein